MSVARAPASFLVLAIVAFVAPAGPAAAQRGGQSAEDAIAALESRHYTEAGRIAQTLIEQGTRTGPELAPLYRVLGLAAAYTNDDEAARVAFTQWLALEPEGRLERTLPDEIRSPFMEARGFWSASTVRLGATGELAENLTGILVRVTDPSSMAARVRVRVRLPGGAWADAVRPPAAELVVATPGLGTVRSLDYSLTFLDEHGNRIWQDGTDAAPRHLEVPSAVAVSDGVPVVPTAQPSDATGFHIGAVIAAVVAVGAVVGAAIAHSERERLAGLYNGDGSGCTGNGALRQDVCAPQRSGITGGETAAIVLYSVAGAAAVTAAVLLAIAPSSSSSESDVALRCGPGPGLIGLTCGGSF